MNSVRKATLLSLAQRYVAFAIQLASSIIMARLLSPSETGVFSLAAAFVAVAQLLRDFGIGEYVLQEKDLTRDRLRSVLGVSLLIAWFMALLIFLLADPLARYYEEPGLRQVIHVLAVNFLLLPIGTTTFAVLSKQMAFKEIFWVQTLSAAIGTALAIVLAWRGHSYMSLAWSSITSTAVTIVMLAIIRPGEIFMLPSFRGLREIGRFGGIVTTGRLVDQLCRRAPDMLIAQGLGFHAVGLNSKATSLLDAFQDFFVSGINRVAAPAFARHRHEQQDPRNAYLQAIRTLAVFPFCFFILLGLLAEPLVMALFGKAWMDAVPLIRIGALAGIVSAPYFLSPPVLTAHGRVKEILVVQLLGGALFILALFLAASHSLVAVAIAGVFGTAVKSILLQRALHTCIGLGPRLLLAACGRGMLVGLLAGASAVIPLQLYAGDTRSALAALVSAGTCAGLVCLLALFGLKHPLADELKNYWHRRQSGA